MHCFRLKLLAAALVLAVAPLTLGAQLVPGAPPTDWSEAQKEFRLTVLRDYNALIGGWHSALNGGDPAAAAAVYADSAQLLVSGRELVLGRASITAFLRTFAGELQEVRTGVTDFLASDRLAYATGPMILTLRTPDSGLHSLRGQHVTVLVREGKRWRIRSQVLKYEPTRPGED